MFIDAHCHITGDEFDEKGGIDGVLQRARAHGVTKIVCSGIDIASSKKAAELAERYEEVYFCAGFHPSELAKYREGDLDEIAALCKREKCVAVGEIGLDYHFEDNPPKETQRELFVRQLRLANELGLPVVLHSRDAAGETLEILEAHTSLLQNSGLMHCYSYSPEMAERFLALGLYFSFGGPSTFKNAKKVWESIQRIPADRILSETDCPYLTPAPFRGEFPNEPKNVKYVVERLAELKGNTVEELAKRIEKNVKELFFKIEN
ncbi:MAG: TatD family deoxyribonuclease [Clostridiales bacterium]|nr:TatD family deoxyribonuclease [Clostridiales bacterium]